MSTTYDVQAGDTFATLSRRAYGSEANASLLARANPGASEPLKAGTTLTAPSDPAAPKVRPPRSQSDDINSVSITIDGAAFRFWTEAVVRTSIDAIPTVDFSAPFHPQDPLAREAFRPFTYKPVAVEIGGEETFTGTAVSNFPVNAVASNTVQVSAYSTPGVLDDCTVPASALPAEFNGQTLAAIAATLAAPFGIGVRFPDGEGAAFSRVAIEPTKKVWVFLADLAQQRGLVITANAAGELVFKKEQETGSPVARLIQGESPLITVTPTYNPQEYYTHVTGIEPVKAGEGGSQFTAANPRTINAIRPLTFTVNDAEGGDVKGAVQAKLSRMTGNAVSYEVALAGWRTPEGDLWRENTTVTLVAPGVMVYKEYEFLIKSVALLTNGASNSSTLTLVLPGSFSGTVPEAMPWDE